MLAWEIPNSRVVAGPGIRRGGRLGRDRNPEFRRNRCVGPRIVGRGLAANEERGTRDCIPPVFADAAGCCPAGRQQPIRLIHQLFERSERFSGIFDPAHFADDFFHPQQRVVRDLL